MWDNPKRSNIHVGGSPGKETENRVDKYLKK